MPDSTQAVIGAPRPESGSGDSGSTRARNFRLLWIGESTSQVGSSVSEVVLPIIGIKVLHAGPLVITSLFTLAWAPWLMFGLPAGVWVDRLRKRRLMIVCDLVSLLLFSSVAVAALLGVLTVAQLLVVALLGGIVSVFFKAAFQAYIPTLLGADELMAGNAKLQGGTSFAQVSGPSLGGVIGQFLGVAVGVLVNAASFAVSALCLSKIRSDEPSESKVANRDFRREIGEGLRFLIHDPYLRPLVIFSSMVNLGISGIDSLMVIFIVRTVGVSPSWAGAILASMGVGALFGSAISARLVRRFGSARALFACKVMQASALLVPLTTHGAGLIFGFGWLIVGAGTVAGNVVSLTFRQSRCPARMRGRVSASHTTMTYSSLAVGAALAGGLASLVGVRPALWVMATVLALASLVLFFSPIRRLRDLPEPAE